jgi:hypothetical protein
MNLRAAYVLSFLLAFPLRSARTPTLILHGFQEPAHWVHMLDAWAAWFDRHGGKLRP